jgi:hypothetical protein
MSALFIGGSRDGEQLEVEDRETIRVPVPDKAIVTGFRIDSSKSARHFSAFKTETYRRERLRAGRAEWTLYILRELSIEAGLEMLLAGYRSGRPRRE